MSKSLNHLRLTHLHIDTYKDPVVYLNADSQVCQSEGFEARTRVRVTLKDKFIIATINMVQSNTLSRDQAGLSDYAWKLLDAHENDIIIVTHPKPLKSLTHIRSKIYGNIITEEMSNQIIEDTIAGRLSDVHLSAFITACSGYRMQEEEILNLSRSMINTGNTMQWPSDIIVDKHCVGGLPGNRTTLIVVPIVTAFGLTMPKTSSRSITSPAGTADTMEVFTSVTLTPEAMKKVVHQEGGCIAWGGSVNLSPADDILIRIERSLNIDSEGQMVASILSKKVSAGATHVVIDIPTGPSSKIRDLKTAQLLEGLLIKVGHQLGLSVQVMISDGTQPVGKGIGPALEAQDVIKVLQNHPNAPTDLKSRSLTIASKILACSSQIKQDEGLKIAEKILNSGQAWKKFQALCLAQGSFNQPTVANHTQPIFAPCTGIINEINNRSLARIAKLAGAPSNKAAGIYLHKKVNDIVDKGDPIYTIHAETKGELLYAISALEELPSIYIIEEN